MINPTKEEKILGFQKTLRYALLNVLKPDPDLRLLSESFLK